jgi:hypothetical protein
MDPTVWHGIAEAVAPCMAILALGAIPFSLVFLNKHFKLKTRELELEAELHGRESQSRIRAMETRQAALEGALQQLVNSFQHRADLSPPPPRSEPLELSRPVLSIAPKE